MGAAIGGGSTMNESPTRPPLPLPYMHHRFHCHYHSSAVYMQYHYRCCRVTIPPTTPLPLLPLQCHYRCRCCRATTTNYTTTAAAAVVPAGSLFAYSAGPSCICGIQDTCHHRYHCHTAATTATTAATLPNTATIPLPHKHYYYYCYHCHYRCYYTTATTTTTIP